MRARLAFVMACSGLALAGCSSSKKGFSASDPTAFYRLPLVVAAGKTMDFPPITHAEMLTVVQAGVTYNAIYGADADAGITQGSTLYDGSTGNWSTRFGFFYIFGQWQDLDSDNIDSFTWGGIQSRDFILQTDGITDRIIFVGPAGADKVDIIPKTLGGTTKTLSPGEYCIAVRSTLGVVVSNPQPIPASPSNAETAEVLRLMSHAQALRAAAGF